MEQNVSFLADLNSIWESFKNYYLSKMSSEQVKTWFGSLLLVDFDSDTATITMKTESSFKYKILITRYLEDIQDYFSDTLKFTVNVRIVCDDIQQDPVQEPAPSNPAQDASASLSSYKFRYTFENFIVGGTNRFAHAACRAVVDRPAEQFNPLFIYGPSGLGKTHLMNAIINDMRIKNPSAKLIYVKGDDFTNQMVDCLSRQAMQEFRDKFRLCDMLLIDDIQFIAGKVATQEEFFHTFDKLYEDGKQIVLTSDRPPKDINHLEDRLRTRFESGLIADIQPPDLELRMAIIKKKAEQVNLSISEEILTYLAENLRSNIRQIEGAIKKLGAQQFLNGIQSKITLDMAKSCVDQLLGEAEPLSVTIDKIFSAVYRVYGVDKADLVGKNRSRKIALPRHVSIYLIRSITEMSFPNIGKIFDKDHSTIVNSISKVQSLMFSDSEFNKLITDLEKEIRSSVRI